ncbi:MAG TPA: phytoene/squalene synthase family protein [Acidimicrobiales bacterium]|nr:phytoene/squalene synthase family protein [Acidimicrobiales bacterium]
MTDAAVALAYKHCEEITRTRARNFYYGVRLLPRRQRFAMCALYAMARRIDDVGDDVYHAPGMPSSTDERLLALDGVRQSLALLAKAVAGGPAALFPGDPVLMALADAAKRFPLPLEALDELVEGCEWDIRGRAYDDFDELVEYCRRVAGTVGRLSLAVYGSRDPERAPQLAEALGVALQLTNILRDLVEDRDLMGRVYLPRADRERFGIGPRLDGDPEDLIALVCFETGRAAEWYQRGLPLLDLLDQRSRACTATMAGIYRRLLDKIRECPERALGERARLSTGEKLRVTALALAGGTP